MAAVKSRTARVSDGKKRPVTKRVDPSIKKGRKKPAAKKAAPARKRGATAAKKPAATNKTAERIVRLRDKQGKAWAEIIETVDLSGSQVRRLYRAAGGKGRRS